MNTTNNQMLKKSAMNAGILYLLLIPIGMFALAFVPAVIFVDGNMDVTVANLRDSEILFRWGTVGMLVMNIISIALVLELYQLFRSTGQRAALYMLALLMSGAVISLLTGAFDFAILNVALSGDASVLGSESAQFWVTLFMGMRLFASHIAVLFWGLWLFPIGFLVIKSGFLPKILGILLIVAGFGYLIDGFVHLLALDFGFVFSDYTFIGELTFTLWLVFKGVKTTPNLVPAA